MIQIENLKKKYGELEVLKGINLTIQTGEIFGIVGKSGEGKTTLLNCLSYLEPPDTGLILLDGEVISGENEKQIREYRKKLGMIFQHFSLMERKNVYKNIALPMECWKKPKQEIDNKVRELSKIVGIEEKLFSIPHTLSGGQKQRVAIARALALEPSLLLCDEATSALDPKTTRSILSLLRDINEKMNLTIVVVTHEMEVIRQICHKVAIIENGNISVCGDTQEIFLKQPLALKRLLGEEEKTSVMDGMVIKIVFRNALENNYFIPEMARSLNVKFSIISSAQEQFRDSLITTTLLKFEEKDRETVARYFEERDVRWEVLSK